MEGEISRGYHRPGLLSPSTAISVMCSGGTVGLSNAFPDPPPYLFSVSKQRTEALNEVSGWTDSQGREWASAGHFHWQFEEAASPQPHG